MNRKMASMSLLLLVCGLVSVRVVSADTSPGEVIGCAEFPDNTGFFDFQICEMSEQFARDWCCNKNPGFEFFALGGLWLDSPAKTHHNGAKCFTWADRPKEYVHSSKCNIGCPGNDHSYDASKWGLCGGGCKDCPTETPCDGDTTAKCGVYRSIYACNDGVTPVPDPEGEGDGNENGGDNGGDGGDSADGDNGTGAPEDAKTPVGNGSNGDADGNVGGGGMGAAQGTTLAMLLSFAAAVVLNDQ